MSGEVAYKALHGGKKELTAAYAQFSGFDPKIMGKSIGVDYHSGAGARCARMTDRNVSRPLSEIPLARIKFLRASGLL